MIAVQARFKERFGCRNYQANKVMYRWMHKFRIHGTLVNLNAHLGRPKTARSPANIDVRDSVGDSPCKSIHRRNQKLSIPRESIRRILVQDLQLYPHRIQVKDQLIQRDKNSQVVMRTQSFWRMFDPLMRRTFHCLDM